MRSRAVLGSVLAIVGVLLMGAAAILHYVVVPRQSKLPSDTDETRHYAGTANVLVNPQALATGDRVHGVITNVPINATQVVQVVASTGSAAQVTDKRTLTTANGQAIGGTSNTYAVERRSLEATTSHPSDWTVTPAEGLTVSFPIPAKKQNYTGWVPETQTTTQLTYTREETVGGTNTYVYTANVNPTPIKDKQVLGTLPQALPVTVLQALPIPDQLKAPLAQALPSLGNPIQLAYTYSNNATYWIQPTSGRVIKVQQDEKRQAGLAKLTGVPGIPVYDVTTQTTQASINDAVNLANHDSNRINNYGRTLPIVLGAIGVVLLIGGILLAVMSRRRPPAVPPTATATPVPE
jgi:Porin PorA